MRDKKMVLLGMMSAVLVGTWAYHIYDKSRYSKNGTPAGPVVDNSSIKDSLQAAYASAISEMDERLIVTQTNADSIRGQLMTKLDEIEKLKGEINAILQNSTASKKDLQSAQGKITQLQVMINDLEEQKNNMEAEKKQLTSTMAQLTQRVDSLTEDIRKLDDENKKLVTRVNESSVFVASGVRLAAVTVRNERELETSLLKKAFKFIVSFNVQNHISDYTNADVFVVIMQPNGEVMKNDDVWESTTTTTVGGKALSYTRKVRFDYEKGETKSLLFSLTPEGFHAGTYTVKLYHKGVSIGESRMTLK